MTYNLLCTDVSDRAFAFEFEGRDFSGWGFSAEVGDFILPGWVTDGEVGRFTLSVPMAVSNAFQRKIQRGVLFGHRPDGVKTVLGEVVLNGLEQP